MSKAEMTSASVPDWIKESRTWAATTRRFCSTPVIPVISSREGGVKPSWRKEETRGAYSNQRPRRFDRISRRDAVSRERYLEGSGDGGGRKGWYRFGLF